MSKTAREAVWASHLESSWRLLAIALADICPNDHGTEIWPGVPLLTTRLNVSARAVHRGLKELLSRQILVHDGYHGRVRRYRFDFDRLAAYRPSPTPRHQLPRRPPSTGPTSGAHGRSPNTDVCHPRQKSARQRLPRTSEVPQRRLTCTSEVNVPTSDAGVGRPVVPTLPFMVATSDVDGTVLCHPRSGLLTQASPEPLEPKEQKEQVPPEQPPPSSAPSSPTTANAGSSNSPTDDARTRPDFRLYAAIATEALNEALRERDDSVANVSELAKRRCAAQRIDYDVEIMREAIDAAMTARRHAKDQFFAGRPSKGGSPGGMRRERF